MDVKSYFSKVLNDPRRVPVAVGFIAFGAGVGLGYILGKRQQYELVSLTDRLDIDPSDEIIEIKQNAVKPPPVIIPEENHPTFNKKLEETQTPMSIVNNPEPLTDKVEYHKIAVDDKEDSVVDKVDWDETIAEDIREKRTLFAKDTDEWDYEKEIKTRTPTNPYVIHRDEFFEDSMQYAQITVTYYAGDNILVDEDESPIYNHDSVVGELKFGHGSDDPNVVYIRNDRRKAEYEVLYDSGMYSVEVLGLEMETNERAKDLKHSRIQKFRPE